MQLRHAAALAFVGPGGIQRSWAEQKNSEGQFG